MAAVGPSSGVMAGSNGGMAYSGGVGGASGEQYNGATSVSGVLGGMRETMQTGLTGLRNGGGGDRKIDWNSLKEKILNNYKSDIEGAVSQLQRRRRRRRR